MLVAVGSNNPVKVEAVRIAFHRVFPDGDWSLRGCDAVSGVSRQPMSDMETLAGARGRASYALRSLRDLDVGFGVGIEGGLQKIDGHWFNTAWVVVVDSLGAEGIGRTTSIVVPDELMDLVQAGQELGDACDSYFGSHNSKQQGGLVGIMTNQVLDRTGVIADGVVAALARFLRPAVFAQRPARADS